MSFRPDTLTNLIGQDNIKRALQICIDASKARNKSVPHILFQGPPGLGKSTLGYIIANEIKSYCTCINASTITSQAVLVKALAQSKDRDIIFIDEIHSLPEKFAELLYMPLEDNKLLIQQTQKHTNEERSVTIPLKDFTLIGATTNIGKIPKPLLDRMNLKFFLDFYSEEDIAKIIQKNADISGLTISKPGIKNIASKCKGIPRLANSYILWIEDFASARKTKNLNLSDIEEAFSIYGIDEMGLDTNDKMYLDVLKQSKEPLGLKSISSMCGIPEKSIEEHIEPYLLRCNLITKTKKGRILTEKLEPTSFPQDLKDIINAYQD